MRKLTSFMCCALLVSAAVQADDREGKTLYAAANGESRWQHTSAVMSSDTYQHTVHRNRDIVRQQLHIYSDRLRERAGAYGQAVGVLGAAVAIAATDQRYHLNDSKSVGVVLRDTASSERTVLLEYRKSW